MKKVLMLILILTIATVTDSHGQGRKKGESFKADTIKIDSLEHRLIVLDPGFETWLISQPARDFYSQQYYEIRNRQYVTEWNLRYHGNADGGIYTTSINYDFNTDYGIDVNYRLYYYFRFFEDQTGIRLLPTSRY